MTQTTNTPFGATASRVQAAVPAAFTVAGAFIAAREVAATPQVFAASSAAPTR